MSYYELPAEGRGYYLFAHRPILYGAAHFHSALEFVFVEKGCAEVNLDGECRLLSTGQACFADSFCVHSYRDAGSLVYVLLGDKSYFENFFGAKSGRTFPKFFSFSDYALLETLLTLCGAEREKDNAHMVFRGATDILLGNLAESVPMEEKREDKRSTLVCEILRYAQANARGDLSLTVLSRRFGYSREHLSRLLHTYLRENWNHYVNRLRALQAERLLQENIDKNVLEIAYECGFESANTFYRAYKKEFGKSPRLSSFKKQINI